MFDVAYLAPHADDVAFSAAAHVAQDVAAGRRVLLLTVFEAREAGPFGDAAARREEDVAYAKKVGAHLESWAWPDAIVRHPRYRRLWRVLGKLPDEEQATVLNLQSKLQALVDAGCTEIVAPIGFGGHVDHQIVHLAAQALERARVRFYEDTPYILMGRDWTTRFSFWSNAPLFASQPWGVRHLMAGTVAALSNEALEKNDQTLVAQSLSDVESVKMGAVACYPSQWRQFYSSLDQWREALHRYATSVGESGVVERLLQRSQRVA